MKTILLGKLSMIKVDGEFSIILRSNANIDHLPQWWDKMLKITIEELD